MDDENANVHVGRVVDDLVGLAKRTGVAVLIVDHDSKAGVAARGASAKTDSAEFVWHLVRPDDEDPDYLELQNEKSRDPVPASAIGLRRVCGEPEGGLHPLRFERTSLRRKKKKSSVGEARGQILDRLAKEGTQSVSQLVAFCAAGDKTVRQAIGELESSGEIFRTGRVSKQGRSPFYTLADASHNNTQNA